MAITTALKENWKGHKTQLQNEISALNKQMSDFKDERKSEWKLFKVKFKDDMDKVEKSFKKMVALQKK